MLVASAATITTSVTGANANVQPQVQLIKSILPCILQGKAEVKKLEDFSAYEIETFIDKIG